MRISFEKHEGDPFAPTPLTQNNRERICRHGV